MGTKIIVFLLTLFTFLTWLFMAIYFSTENDWWSVLESRETSYDTAVVGVSYVTVLLGTGLFLAGGTLVYMLIRRK
ncbi:hypothetical protein N288_04585 [Bacillus infantis NRRL B-14911]|uniref:Uncharacterized protein n=1 Tax=Bacillus infantis NRRL B-14911 TaxID=1367477 RepID=U5L566_9BACI|nr:hypothetical protein N288_04585 [Bacillus infantis NRRL B-14911]